MGLRGPDRRGYSEELATIMNTVFGDLSELALERRVRGEISTGTFGRLRHGKIVTSRIFEVIARHFEPEFSRHYRQEIEQAAGKFDPHAIQAWLHRMCELPRPLESEEPVSALRQFKGAADLPPEDLDTLGAIVSAFITDRRRARGLE